MTPEMIMEAYGRGGLFLLTLLALGFLVKWGAKELKDAAAEAKNTAREEREETRKVSASYVGSIEQIQKQTQARHEANVAALTNLADSVKPLPVILERIETKIDKLPKRAPKAAAARKA